MSEAMRPQAGWAPRAARVLAVSAALSLTAVLAADVLAREVLGRGFDGARELAVLAMIAWVAAGIALSALEARELRPRLFDALIPPSLRAAHARLGDGLAALGYLALAAGMVGLAAESLTLGEASPVLALPPALGMSLLAVSFAVAGGARLRWALRPSARPEEGRVLSADGTR